MKEQFCVFHMWVVPSLLFFAKFPVQALPRELMLTLSKLTYLLSPDNNLDFTLKYCLTQLSGCLPIQSPFLPSPDSTKQQCFGSRYILGMAVTPVSSSPHSSSSKKSIQPSACTSILQSILPSIHQSTGQSAGPVIY